MPSATDLKPDSYYQNVREEVLRFIPTQPRTVLDVGCGEGLFGARVKQSSDCEVWGIELAPDAARRAEARLDRVLRGDVGTLIDRLPEHYFDVIVFNDILEHLIDPFDVLARVKASLSDEGVVVSSIPNVRFYPTMYELLVRKSWEYEDSGILDRTHLRFFTERSIREMYERLGYEVLRHEGINEMARLPRRYRVVNALLGGRLHDMRYVQFATVARARRADKPQAAANTPVPGVELRPRWPGADGPPT